MNLPMLADVLEKVGVPSPIICCNYNKIGFRMCGGIEAYDRVLETRDVRVHRHVGLASGAIPAEEAIKWVCEREQIRSIVFGASSAGNIRQTIELITNYTRS